MKAQQGEATHLEHRKAAGKGKKQTATPLRAEQQLADAPSEDFRLLRRLTEKTAEHEAFKQADASLPAVSVLPPSDHYWIRDGTYWKRVHVKPRTVLYEPEHVEHGPDINMLTPYRSKMARPISRDWLNKFDDEWTGEQKETPFTWTGSANFEEKEQYKGALETSDDEHRPQQGLKAKSIKAPTQPTPQ